MRQVAVVTGAAGGIGTACVRALVGEGWHVLALDLRPLPAEEHVTPLRVDHADLDAMRDAGRTACELGPVGAVVHNAAVQVIGAVGEISLDDWHTTLAVNLLAADVLVGATKDALRANKGAVVVVSSVHAVATTRGMAAYATSKAALEGWVRAAALDLAPEVRVNAVRPGAVDTRMLRDGLVRRPEDGTEDEALARLAAKVPLGRIISPEDVARLVVALTDPDSPLPLTGASVTVDGGALLRLGTE